MPFSKLKRLKKNVVLSIGTAIYGYLNSPTKRGLESCLLEAALGHVSLKHHRFSSLVSIWDNEFSESVFCCVSRIAFYLLKIYLFMVACLIFFCNARRKKINGECSYEREY